MIIQYRPIADNISFAQFGNISNNKFFHDHFTTIKNIEQPYISGELNGKNQSFILYFKLSNITVANSIRIRGLNCTFKDIKPNFSELSNWEVEIDIKKNLEKDIYILFDCNKAYGEWKLIFGEGIPLEPHPKKIEEWTYCRAAFDYLAVIRVSKPLNEDEGIELPRFITSPKYSYEYIGNALRGSVGQPYGRNIRQLKTLNVQFARVKSYAVDEYIKKVGLAVPHFIVPYPENIFNVPPIWGTLAEFPEFTKRNENNWYWNLGLSWKEAY